MTSTLDAPAAAPVRQRAEPDSISDGFFRGAFATLVVGGLLFLGIFGTVAYTGSLAQVSDSVHVEQGAATP